MIAPRKVKFEAKKREHENIEFRTFLKCNADSETLDRQFARLHEALFASYDCNRCRNCCKMYCGSVPAEDMQRNAEYLGMAEKEFLEAYFIKEIKNENYQTKHKPCDFLEEDGSCKLDECKPQNCKDYPYTNQPERLSSLYSVLDAVEVCPVAFEIFEQLKKEYGFRYRNGQW